MLPTPLPSPSTPPAPWRHLRHLRHCCGHLYPHRRHLLPMLVVVIDTSMAPCPLPPSTPIHVTLPLSSSTPNTLPSLPTPPFVVVDTCLLLPSTPLHVTLPLSSSTPNISALATDTFVTHAHMTPPPLLLTPDTSTGHFHLRYHRQHLCDPCAHDTSALTIDTSRTLATPPTPPPSLPTPLPSLSTPPWHLAQCHHHHHFT